jgi:DNA polymerase III sliding clamp (beta) subunit (PCNA family)
MPPSSVAQRHFYLSKIHIQLIRRLTMAKANYSTVPSASLAKALSTVVRASGKDPYQMVHVQAQNGKLSVRCFNGLMGILAITAAEDKGSAFDATIEAQAFASLVSSMNGAVTLSPSGKNGLQVQSGSVDVTLKGINKTLPEFEDKDANKVLTINGQDLIDLLRVGSCAATDIALAYAAVLVNVTPGGTSSWATDSFRAATCVKAVGGESANILLPFTLVSWLRSVSPRATVMVKSSEKRVTFEADDGGNIVKITSPVNDASKYPALSKIFDAMFAASGIQFTLDADTMSKAARQAKTLGADTVALHTDNGNLYLRAKSQTASYNNTISKVDGQIAIFLDPQFLSEGMGLFMDAPEVLFLDTKKPLCAKEGDFRILFMPKNPPAEKKAEEVEAVEATPVAVSAEQFAEVAA